MNSFPNNNFITLFSRPPFSNQHRQQELLHHHIAHVTRNNSDSEERPMTSTGRRRRNPLQDDVTQHDESFVSHELPEGNEVNSIFISAHRPHELLNPMYISILEQLQSNIDEDINEGLPKEMIDKLKKMKIGKSGQDCTVCSESFRKGEKIRKLPCKHIFHETCIMPWLASNSTCPNCRLNLFEYFTENPDEEYH